MFRPLLEPARYKGAHGGRGSGKSHFFGEMLVEDCLAERGMLGVCIREVQKTLEQSSKRLIETKIHALKVNSEFRIYNDKIATPGDGLIIFQGMQDHTAESIKSLEGFKRAWVEEAQTLSARSLALLRPTIRAAGSQLWASWNPRRKSDAIDEFLRGKREALGSSAIVVEANWRDNPWFPKELEEERKLDLELYPERYDHTWEGAYARAFEGAYFAKQLGQAKREGRIEKHLTADPLLPIRAFWDIGGSGAEADANSIWIGQFVGQKILLLDYIETLGQPLAYIVNELRSRGWERAICILPHDGIKENEITSKRYKDHLSDAGFDVPMPIPNQGRGAAAMRIEAVRRILPKCWFDEQKTEAGRDALGYYHERKDETRNIGLGPEHDWSSHCADAFGLMAIAYEEPSRTRAFQRKIVYPQMGVV